MENIIIKRDFFKSKLWKTSRRFSKVEAYLDLFQLSNDNGVVKKEDEEVNVSLLYLKSRWDWSVTKVNLFLNNLEGQGLIKKIVDNKRLTVIIKEKEETNNNLSRTSRLRSFVEEEEETKSNTENKTEESKIRTKTPNFKIDFNGLLEYINKATGRRFRKINDAVKRKFIARLKEGYTKEDILTAINNAVDAEFHKKNDFFFLTPEFFSRANTLDKYSVTQKKKAKPRHGIAGSSLWMG